MEFDGDARTDQSTTKDPSIVRAKSFLLTASTQSGLNLYDHLSRVLTKILDEKPNNVVDVFEDLSRDVKREKFRAEDDTIRLKSEKSSEIKLAEVQQKLFLKGDGLDASDAEALEEETDSPLPNLLELCYYFEQAGIGLNREEIVRIWLALSRLTETQPVTNVRFWGKVLGIEQNYIVAEVEFREGEGEEEEERDEVDDVVDEPERERDDEDEEEVEIEVDDTPKLNYKPPPAVPKEENRTGANKKTFFVCNEPGGPWVKLPSVTPDQITTARKIKKFFTGRLDATLNSYPPFPGTEANYLRAQIARISAGTQISPLGFYQFDEEEEDDDEGGIRDKFIENAEFEPIPVKDLVDPTLTNWVHHVQHILPQGRTTWWNPRAKNDPELEENEEEEEVEQPDEMEPEAGPPLLTPLSEDTEIGTTSPWTTRLSSRMVPQYAIAVVQSCLWPGAHAFCSGKHFDNIYIGWGHKYLPEGHNPVILLDVQEEFPTGPEVSEVDDPTPDQEDQLKNGDVQGNRDEVLEENDLEDAPDEDEEDD